MFLLLFRTFFLFNEGPIRTFLLFVEEFIHAKQFYQCEGFIAAASATSAVIATFHVLIGHGSVVGAASASRSCCMIFVHSFSWYHTVTHDSGTFMIVHVVADAAVVVVVVVVAVVVAVVIGRRGIVAIAAAVELLLLPLPLLLALH